MLERGVVQHGRVGVPDVPAQRRALPLRDRPTLIEREDHRLHHGDQDPRDVGDRDHPQEPRLAPRVRDAGRGGLGRGGGGGESRSCRRQPARQRVGCSTGSRGSRGSSTHEQDQDQRSALRHEDRQDQRVDDRRCRSSVCWSTGREQLLGEVVTEHRQRTDHEPREDALLRLGERDAPERPARARAEVAARLELRRAGSGRASRTAGAP